VIVRRPAVWVPSIAGILATLSATPVLKFGKIVGKQHLIGRFSAWNTVHDHDPRR
jgi:hypothetical protein